MTRREREILKASVSWTDKVLTVKEEKAFQAGARWADKTMIDKACSYLYAKTKMSGTEIAAFRKAMEE